MNELIKIENLHKQFRNKRLKKVEVLKGISFSFEEGEIYGLVGNNGVGKTTLLRTICGMTQPTSGKINFAKPNLKLGVLIESPGLYGDMSGFQNLKTKAIACGYKYTDEQLAQQLQEVGLQKDSKNVRHYSTGMKQRLGIALALMGEPDVLILDEPINGLDPQGIADMRKILNGVHEKRGITMIISSHILEELLKVATHFVLIKDGVVVKDITHDQLMEVTKDIDVNEYYLSVVNDGVSS